MPQDVTETDQDAETQDPGGGTSSSDNGPESDGSEPSEVEGVAVDVADAEAEAGQAELDPLDAALDENKRLKDQLLRTAADFDNFRKRSRREITDAVERGREDLLKELLPVFDNLERAAEHAQSATDVAALSDGIQLVMKQFMDTVSRLGVEKIDATGEVFDPALHEAIQQLETNEVPAGAVANQVQAGYKMGGRLVRPCMVVVAKAPSGD